MDLKYRVIFQITLGGALWLPQVSLLIFLQLFTSISNELANGSADLAAYWSPGMIFIQSGLSDLRVYVE